MALAPEPYLSACLEVMYKAIIAARVLSWQGAATPEQIADLMDAVHNIPFLIQNWETCDIELLRHFLRFYDDKWAKAPYWLLATFDEAIEAGGVGLKP